MAQDHFANFAITKKIEKDISVNDEIILDTFSITHHKVPEEYSYKIG